MGMVLKGIQQRKDMMNSRSALCLCVCGEWNGVGQAKAGSPQLGHVSLDK